MQRLSGDSAEDWCRQCATASSDPDWSNTRASHPFHECFRDAPEAREEVGTSYVWPS